MKTLKQHQTDAYIAILKEAPSWEHSDGDFGLPGYEEQWDTRYATSYVSQLTEDRTWTVAFFIGGPDHGIVEEGEVGEFKNSIEARLAAFRHAADEEGSYAYYEEQMMASMYYDSEDEVPRESVEEMFGEEYNG